jgi:hypothetical protein
MKTALRMILGVAAASLLGLPAFALNVTDQVKINEVSYDPSEVVAPSDENPWEYIELYNAGATTAYLDGAVISDEGNVGTAEASFKFPGTPGGTTIPLASHAYMLLLVDVIGSDNVTISPFKALASFEFFGGNLASDTDDPTVPNLTKTAGTAVDLLLGNSGDGITLSIGTTTGSVIPCGEVVDGVTWEGNTTDVTAMSSTVCTDPASNPGYANTGTDIKTLQRCPDGADTDNSTNDFSVADRTPKAANGCSNIAPIIASLRYQPCFVTAGQQVSITCDVTDDNNNITSVRVFYKLEAAASFDSLTMALTPPSTYAATLPGQIDQSRVLFYVVARDATGNVVKNPSTAPGFTRDYRVGLQTIAALQTPTVNDSCGASSQLNKAFNIVGVVTHQAFEYSGNFFYIQQGITANSGIKVFTTTDSSFVPQYGDSVRVSGYVDEFHCQTELVLFADCGTILGHNRKVRARQLAAVTDINKEENESMLVKVQGPIPVLNGFDTTNLGQEFEVGSGANVAYVGDDTFFPDGIGYTPVPVAGNTLDDLTGIVGYRRVDTTPVRANQSLILRLEPRRNNDVNLTWTDTGDPNLDVVRAFGLKQNTPNPFNPVTTIEFAVPTPGAVQLRIYDVRGQVVRTLVDREFAAPAHERATWDGRDEAGQVVPSGVYFYKLIAGSDTATRKMLLLK